MMKRKPMRFALAAVTVWMTMGLTTLPARADDDELTFDRVKVFIEFNATDEDVGIQVLLDGEPWERVRLLDPRGRKLLDIRGRSSVRVQGLSELFFESSEPSLDEVPLDEFLRRFPVGEYEFEGRTIEGEEIEGEAILTHVIPAGAEIVWPVPAGEDPPVVDPNNLVIEWEAVDETIDGSGDVEIVGYQVIVEREDPLRVLSIDLPADVLSVLVPPGFLKPGTLHGFEVLAIEASGNQTISAGEFVTLP